MNIQKIIQAAYPNATDSVIDAVVWGRTPYPFTYISAKQLYKAASGLYRANCQGKQLCDFCERKINPKESTCEKCSKLLNCLS